MVVTLGGLLDILGSGEFLRIGYRSKNGWAYYGRTIHADSDFNEDRNFPVYNMYTVEKTKDYEAGIAIVLDDIGSEE